MEHPAEDIGRVIRSLCQGSPEEQQDAINRYYDRSASFSHPIFRVPSFESVRLPVIGEVDSRMLVLALYRWYTMLGPKINIEVDSSVFDQRAHLLYVTSSQTSPVWFLPFRRRPVRLVSVLTLAEESTSGAAPNGNPSLSQPDHEPGFASVASTSIDTSAAVGKTPAGPQRNVLESGGEPRRYRITKHEDLYQISELAQMSALGLGGLACAWLQLASTALCLLGVLLLSGMPGRAENIERAFRAWMAKAENRMGNMRGDEGTANGNAAAGGQGGGQGQQNGASNAASDGTPSGGRSRNL